MWSGLTNGLSGALQSLDQAARDVINIELEDESEESDGEGEENLGQEVQANGNGGDLVTIGDNDHSSLSGLTPTSGRDAGAYDAPFGAQVAAVEYDAHVGDDEAPASVTSLLGRVGGALGGGAAALVSSVASKTNFGEVGGNLWERSSLMRESLSTVTKDVASAMKEELVGVSSTVGGSVKSVSEFVGAGSGSDDDDSARNTHAPPVAIFNEHMMAENTDVEDMHDVAESEFVELDQLALYGSSLEPTPGYAASFTDDEGRRGEGNVEGGRVGGLLGSINFQNLNKVAGNLNTEALLGGAGVLGKVGSEWWDKSSNMREHLSNVSISDIICLVAIHMMLFFVVYYTGTRCQIYFCIQVKWIFEMIHIIHTIFFNILAFNTIGHAGAQGRCCPL